MASVSGERKGRWAKHSLPSLADLKQLARDTNDSNKEAAKAVPKAVPKAAPKAEPQEAVKAAPAATTVSAPLKPRRTLRPRRALITLTPAAVTHLAALYTGPDPKLIRIGVNNRGCSGLTYNLSHVEAPGKFDEVVEQDGVKVCIDSKALFLIVGSEMDWLDDTLASKFVFRNPNSKGTCGCGESFMV